MSTNLFADLPALMPTEFFTTLLKADTIRIERIVSHGHCSPDGFWFNQDQQEWVVILQGAARLRFEGDEHPLEMKPGDFVMIPARKPHRVEWTTAEEPTIWLAVHYGEQR